MVFGILQIWAGLPVSYRQPAEGARIVPSDHRLDHPSEVRQQRVWDYVSQSPLRSLWNLQGVPVKVVAARTWRALLADNLVGRAAELGFFFLFALFPTLFSASSVLGLAARSASTIYMRLLEYMALVVPTAALGAVLTTFEETTAHATTGKLTFGMIASVWSASIGVSAIQDSLNMVYKVRDPRSYFHARVSAIGITVVLSVLATLTLATMLGGDVFGVFARVRIANPYMGDMVAMTGHVVAWIAVGGLLSLCFAVIYYWAPGVKARRWRWLTPGGAVGILGWMLASLLLRVYLHFFDFYSMTYGSLGAVIILLMWFYISGFMLLLGAEINSEIEAAEAEMKLSGKMPLASEPASVPASAVLPPAAQPSSSEPTPRR
jgi:membrane protein